MGQKNKHHFKHTELKPLNPEAPTRHHVPPKHPDITPKPQILFKQRRHHEAYHLLFGAAPSYKAACIILARDWWPDEIPEP